MYADPDEFRQFLHQMPVSYRIAHAPKEIAMHIQLVKEIETASSNQPPVGASYVASPKIYFVDGGGYTELHL